MYYITINNENEITGLYNTDVNSDIIVPENAIEIEKEVYEHILSGTQKYKVVDSTKSVTFDNVEIVEKAEAEETASDDELIRAELLLNQMTILENQSNQDEVLAEILLNQILAEDKGGEENV